MKNILLSFLLCFVTVSFVRANDSCNCRSNLEYMQASVRKNYTGFAKRVAYYGQHQLDSVEALLTKRADSVSDFYSCYKLLREYVSYYKDLHLRVRFVNDSVTKPVLARFFSAWPVIADSMVNEKASGKKYGKNSIVGEYESVYYSNRIAIVETKDGYAGYIVRGDQLYSFPKQLKITISREGMKKGQLTFYNNEHVTSNYAFAFDGSKIEMIAGDVYIKDSTRYGNAKTYSNPTFEALSKQTSLIRLPDFGYSNKRLIDSFVHVHWTELMTKPYLIIDTRNNGGGSVLCYDTLMGLIYTDPYFSEGASRVNSEENIRVDLATMKNFDTSYAQFVKDSIEIMKDSGQYKTYPADTVSMTYQFANPQKIVVLTDGGVSSAAEMLVNFARHSKKVTLMGTNTRGAFDNLDVRHRQMPCRLLRFSVPITSMNFKELFDPVGFTPDIKLDVRDYDQWVKKAMRYLERN